MNGYGRSSHMDQHLDQGGLLVWKGPEEDKAAQPEDCGSMIGDTQLIVMNDSKFLGSLGRSRRPVSLDVNVVMTGLLNW